ncbi:hypothetical protein Syun_027657 [Stephania yunnanensis]|uniref:FAR1 domain-containing protein n=1 Tax=Stephania yunnanensis TaxID=152371 RepID=A0AAP0HQF0_9MAGN
MDDLQIARATTLRDIFGSSDSGSSSYENLGCENNSISLANEITSLNVVQEQDLNISSHPLPAVGMLFDSVDELLTAYQDHAKEKGFAVAIRSSVRDTSSQFKYVSISCDRGRNTYFEKHSKRINCLAKVHAVRQGDNCWSVSKVVVEHNHELIPNLSRFMRGHRKMSMHVKRQLDANDIAGIRPCKSIRMLQVQSGFHWERQFHDAYTKDIFKKVQREIADMIYCHLDPNNEIDVSSVPGVEKLNIKECGISNWYCKEFLYIVEFRANGRHSSIVYSGGYPHMTDEYKKFQEIERALHEAVDLCKNNPASMRFLKREMDALIEKIRSDDIQVDQAQHMDNDASIQGPNYASIRDPTYVRCRGRPRVNRFRSVRERGNSSQGRRNGRRHGRQSRHGGRRDIIDLNEPFIESQNNNVARLNRSLSQPNGPRRGIQSRRGGRMPMTFLTVHNSGETEIEYVSRMLTKIKRFAQHHSCHVWFVAHPRQLQQWNSGPPNLYDISGSAHFINKCDNGIVIHCNRDLEIRPLDQVQVCVRKVRNKVVGTIGDAFLSYNRFAILAFYSSFVNLWTLIKLPRDRSGCIKSPKAINAELYRERILDFSTLEANHGSPLLVSCCEKLGSHFGRNICSNGMTRNAEVSSKTSMASEESHGSCSRIVVLSSIVQRDLRRAKLLMVSLHVTVLRFMKEVL